MRKKALAKKAAAALLAAAMVMASLTGCGSSSKDSTDDTTTEAVTEAVTEEATDAVTEAETDAVEETDAAEDETEAAEEETDAAEDETEAAEDETEAAEDETEAAEAETDAAEDETEATEAETDAAEEETDAADESADAGSDDASASAAAIGTTDSAPDGYELTDVSEYSNEFYIPDETVTLTVYSQTANYSGIMTGWMADLLKEKFNVELNIIPDSDGVFDTRMQSGELGDIIILGSSDDYSRAVENGLLFDWEEDDILADYGTYIQDHMSDALEQNRSLNEDGAIHGYGHDVATSSEDHASFFYSWDIRWDLYAELGYPEVNDLDDLVDLFIAMKEICPTDDNGNQTYAVSLWPDWDGDMVMYVKSMATAYYGYDELGVGLYDPETGDYYDCLDTDGPYLQMLKFFNTLYREGLLDPDSMTQTYETMIAKVQNGGTFFSIFNYSGSLGYNSEEHQAENKLMMSLVPTEASPIVYGLSTLGSTRIWAIGADAEYPELCMEIINYFSTPEGRMTMEYGPEGLMWYYDEDGYTHFTTLGLSCYYDKTTEIGNGYSGSFQDGTLQINNTTWALDAENLDSNGETFNCLNWASFSEDPTCDTEADWREYTGFNTTDNYMESGNYTLSPASAYVASAKSTELKTTWAQVTTCITEGSWNAIYAESDEEYNSIVSQMIVQARSYGYADCVEWSQNEAAIRKAAEDETTGAAE
ncbi:MAG: hypothetical protein LIP12_18365 [Clostridiales bacterium]|nr:hypothetical protein [Clostridiales bacterium]